MITHDPKLRRQRRVRRRLSIGPKIPRLTIFRSNRHLWAQIIDDKHGQTLASASSKNLSATGNRSAIAAAVGQAIAAKAKDKKITHVCFDRGHYRYHGRIKALADAARNGGLIF